MSNNVGAEAAFTLAANNTQGLSLGKIVWGRFVRHKAAMVSAVVLTLTVILVLTSIGVGPIPGWWKWDPNDIPDLVNNGHPTLEWQGLWFTLGEHPFGQDAIGRDVFARTMRGAQVSLMVMVLMGVIATFVGVVIGAFSGFYRGRTDFFLQRGTEIFIAIPTIVVTAVIGRTVGAAGNPALFGIVLGLLLWPGLARLVRADYLSLREREFVDAARVAGANDRSIMFKHILPNAIGVVIVNATLLMATATILEAALSFLGFGIQAPNVSLGNLINEYQNSFSTRPWLFWWPGFFIIVFALTINLIGDGLRDAFDPRQRRIPKTKEMNKQAIVKAETEVAQ